MPGRIARVEVDRSLCIGSGLCVDAAPKVFQLDETNTATVLDPEAATEEEVRKAAEVCPTCAILLYDAAGKQVYPDI
jgi:ferredoxin